MVIRHRVRSARTEQGEQTPMAMSALSTLEVSSAKLLANEFLEELTTILRYTITVAVSLFQQFLSVLRLIINIYNRV